MVDLEGDVEFLWEAYLAIREPLLRRLSSHAALGLGPPPVDEQGRTLAPTQPIGPSHGAYVWVLRCNDLYNKVQVIERAALAKHALARHLDVRRLARVCFEGDVGPPFESLLPPGSTLWSELTSMGRDRLRKA
jgi:hypothetical protein